MAYNLKAYGPPKLVNAKSLDESRFRFTTENIIGDAISYFEKDPDVWSFPAKNYFVRICIAKALADNDKEFYELLSDSSILPYDDRYSKPYDEDKETYDAIINAVDDIQASFGYKGTWKVFGYLYDTPLHGKKVSTGYNLTGQEYFDTILPYKKIHEEFFFSFTHRMHRDPIDKNSVFNGLKNSNQYGIPSNLLLNTEEDEKIWKEEIGAAFNCTDLQSVSVLDMETARKIKTKYPDLRIHISTYGAQKFRPDDLDPEIIYAFNVNEPSWHEEREVVNRCRELGIKIKYIVNRGCVFGKHDMLTKIIGRHFECCFGHQNLCTELANSYPWIDLVRSSIYKEQILGLDADILKISTREKTNESVHNLLKYYTDFSLTDHIGKNILLTENNWSYFAEWIKTKETCSGKCAECRKCEQFYKKMLEA